MASELTRRLAELAERGEWRGPEATMDAARAELDPVRVVLAPDRRRPPGWVFALGAAALALVLVGGVALLVSGSDPGTDAATTAAPTTTPAATVPSSTTQASSTTVTPSTAVPPVTSTVTTEPPFVHEGELPDAWRLLVDGGAPLANRSRVRLEPVSEPRLVAAGIALVAVAGADVWEFQPDASDRAVWVTGDAVEWERVVLPGDAAGGKASAFPVDVTAGGPGLVAVGIGTPSECCVGPEQPCTVADPETGAEVEEPCPGPGSQVAAVWTTGDGRNWTRVPHDTEAFQGADMLAVASDGDRLVAVGYEQLAGCRSCDDFRARSVVWTSDDGVAWTRIPNDGAAFERSFMSDVVAGPAGFVAAGNRDADIAVAGRALLWYSADGTEWARIDLGSTGPDKGATRISALAAGGSGYLFTNHGGFWTSRDGITWTRAVDDPGTDPSPEFTRVWIRDVADTGLGLVAVGETSPSEEEGVFPAVWTSPDGREWRHTPFGPGFPRAVAAVGERIVVVGDGRVWTVDTAG